MAVKNKKEITLGFRYSLRFLYRLLILIHINACDLDIYLQNRQSRHVLNGSLHLILYLLADSRDAVAILHIQGQISIIAEGICFLSVWG